MPKLPKVPKARTAMTIEAGRRALDVASTPRELHDIEKKAQLAKKWAKHQGFALEQQNGWAQLRIEALIKLGQILAPLLIRHRHPKGNNTFRLEDEGISRDLSRLAQTVARASEAVRQQYFAEAERERREITLKDFLERVCLIKKSQHFTGRSEARRLYELTCSIIAENEIKFDSWLEPSAGDGAFYDLLPAHMRLGIDIDSRHPEIVEADFLSFDDFAPGVTYAAIGNFPWARTVPSSSSTVVLTIAR